MFARDPRSTYGVLRAPRRPLSLFIRFVVVAALIILTTRSLSLYRYPDDTLQNIASKLSQFGPSPTTTQTPDHIRALETYKAFFTPGATQAEQHAIDRLIADAQHTQDSLLSQQSLDVATAATRYRVRRGRHPPPGFDKWMAYALEHDAIVVEKFFDRIYHDLTPFWALDPNTTATRAAAWHHVVRVRNGKAQGVGNTEGLVAWLELWTSLVAEAAPHLPDVDMPINYMDESRLLVPYEDIAGYVAHERRHRSMPLSSKVTATYTGLADVDARVGHRDSDSDGESGRRMAYTHDPRWQQTDAPRYWDLARQACHPDSPSRHVPALTDFGQAPDFPRLWRPPFSYHGYIRNFTAAADPCTQPHLRGLHGTFAEPLSMSTATELIPLFGGSKLPMNNEILIPGAMYLTADPFYSGGDGHGPPWEQKNRTVVWRGAASGGRHKKENWRHFQRLRLVEMLNATTVTARESGRASEAEAEAAAAATFEMAPLSLYDYPRRRNGTVGELLAEVSDAGFNDLLCFPRDACDYMTPHFHAVPSMPMAEQYRNKFMPDVDGNSFSARFRGLLLSTSLPLKATLYAEWHDDRLLPWLHFAPLDNTLQDLHAVLDYFLDDKGDAAAHLLAATGKDWAEKVLRRDDMLLYVWRLLLEFARVCDEKRDLLGYMEDLDLSV